MGMNLTDVGSGVIWLSHPWGPSCPAYGGGAKIELQTAQSIARGHSSNSLRFSSSNHAGTHMDAPKHFIDSGRTIDSYSPEELCFSKPFLMDVQLDGNARHISPHHLEALSAVAKKQFQDCDILLLRTGAESYRDEERFWEDGIGLDLGLADYIRAHAPQCRAVGIDTISITAFSNRELGRSVHREFLGGAKPFFLIEDMALAKVKVLKRLMISPLRIEQGDGAPVTIMGFES